MTNKMNAREKKRRDKKAMLQMICEDEIGEIGIEEKWRDRGGSGVPLGIQVVLVGARQEDHSS